MMSPIEVYLRAHCPQCELAPYPAPNTIVLEGEQVQHWGTDCGPPVTVAEMLAWAATPGGAAVVLEAAKGERTAELRAARVDHLGTLYDPAVVSDAALGIPSPAFRNKIVQDRTQCKVDLDLALAQVAAATTPAAVAAVSIEWTITVGANPNAPEYA